MRQRGAPARQRLQRLGHAVHAGRRRLGEGLRLLEEPDPGRDTGLANPVGQAGPVRRQLGCVQERRQLGGAAELALVE
ncbi:MAG TPA: hypothetical protein VFF36_08275, partial [Planctomycetota bacterium]|nr:hypothetical protein [Planctomycetota bacterium]